MGRFTNMLVRLPEETHEELKLKAYNARLSMAELVRRALEAYFGFEKDKKTKKMKMKKTIREAWKNDPFFDIIGMYKDPTMTDGSTRIDEVVYGDMMKKKFHPK